ncbi:MAG: hypothetical protein VB093_09775 [Propionicimonas sp.]|nr:hypothetical protein [Propionicimonas sp.]
MARTLDGQSTDSRTKDFIVNIPPELTKALVHCLIELARLCLALHGAPPKYRAEIIRALAESTRHTM